MDTLRLQTYSPPNWLQPWMAGWLAGLLAITVLIVAGEINARSLLVVWPVLGVIGIFAQITWSDTGNAMICFMILIMPPIGFGFAAYDRIEEQRVTARERSKKCQERIAT